MFQFISEGGPFMILLVIISLGLIILSIKKIIDLFIKKKELTFQDEFEVNAILFWGCICALLGVLGQLSGIYLAISDIASAPELSPQVVLLGIQISFTTTIFGLWVLLISSMAWFILKTKYKYIVENK